MKYVKKMIVILAVLGIVGCGGSADNNDKNSADDGSLPDTQAPTTPATLSASAASANRINLSWSASTDNIGVIHYRIERCQGAGCSVFTEIATPAGTSSTDTGLSANTTYSYRVCATDAAGNNSAYSSIVSATTPTEPPADTTAPTTPAGLSGTAVSSNRIDLSWSASTDNVGVSGYDIYRDGALLDNVTGTSYSDTGLTAGSAYTYQIRARDAAGNSSALSAGTRITTPAGDTTAPTTPAGLTGTAVSSNQIDLSWSASTDNVGVSGYDIYRDGALLDNVTGTSYSDTGLIAGTAYTYQIRARDAAGNISALSAGTRITTPAGQLLFFDDFEYTVGRSDPQAATLFQNNGWDDVKTQQSRGSGYGYFSTVDSIPGYSGSFPGLSSSRALLIEARPATFGGQTDFYLQLGDGYSDLNFIPGDVWFQFWLYPQYYEDQYSQFRGLDKFLYPCGQGHGSCHTHKWLLLFGPTLYNPYIDELSPILPLGKPSNGEFFWNLRNADGVSEITYLPAASWNSDKLGQQDITEWVRPNSWTLVKMHFDTSTSSGSWEAWLKPQGGDWTKVAEWIDGVTPDFVWNVPTPGGHGSLRFPTTIGSSTNTELYDFWLYMDDFAMAGSESALPAYE